MSTATKKTRLGAEQTNFFVPQYYVSAHGFLRKKDESMFQIERSHKHQTQRQEISTEKLCRLHFHHVRFVHLQTHDYLRGNQPPKAVKCTI